MATNEALSIMRNGLSADVGSSSLADQNDWPSPEEGHRLMVAFMSIRHTAVREAIITAAVELSRRDGGGSVTASEQL